MRINFVGDIGLFRKFEELKINPFEKIVLPESDVNIGNLEFITSSKRIKYFYDVQDQYSCSVSYLKQLNFGKFEIIGIANNHVLDYGLEGALETIDILRDKGIQVFGFSRLQDFSIGELDIGGIKICIIACVKKGRWTEGNFGFGPNTYDKDKISALIKKYKLIYDHVIVYPHWGSELIEVPCTEDIGNAKAFIDSGASAVIGHHPHVSQGIEVYKKGLIAYSLGSFIYIHEEELGYSTGNFNRHNSICLNIEFSAESIVGFKPHYYRYNQERKIPELLNNEIINEYGRFLDNNIYNNKLFRKQFVKVLLLRELKSFLLRFRRYPVKTTCNYARLIYLKVVTNIKSVFQKRGGFFL